MPDRTDSRLRRRPALPKALQAEAVRAAELIRSGFDDYTADFLDITRRAKHRFASRDWKGHHQDSIERFDLYEKVLARVAEIICRTCGAAAQDRRFWMGVKRAFAASESDRYDGELAETFFNSVTRKVLMTSGLDRDVEFFHLERLQTPPAPANPVFRTYVLRRDSRSVMADVLKDFRFAAGYEDLDRDAGRAAGEVDLHLWPIALHRSYDSVDIIASPFYRNKVAYIVGRVNAGERHVPLILPLYNDRSGIYVDTALLSEAEASIVFSFAHSTFHVEIQHHGAVIDFLKSVLPEKPIAELYTSLGYHKHGKTEFYRNLHHFVHEAQEQFVIAPGKEGAVMIGFTMPDFEYVFKVIKDRPCFLRSGDVTTKQTTRAEIRERYDLVAHRDRVGRMVDTQEFENLRFKKKRFSAGLLREFRLAAREAVTISGAYVIINHLYVQRKVVPMPLFLQEERDPEEIRRVILDFGFFLKDLAASGIFPYDLFNTWNYGVTRRSRVVLFDYDDVQPLERANFRTKPQFTDHVEELLPDEEQIAARADDFFMDEIQRFSGIPVPLRRVFDSQHADLYSQEFWRAMQRRVKRGEIVDITPYDRRRRFPRIP